MQVRECITTSALLRLPMTMPRAAKLERVEEIIKELVGVHSQCQSWGMCGKVMKCGEGGECEVGQCSSAAGHSTCAVIL